MAPVRKRKANAANCPPEVSTGLTLHLGPFTQKKKSVIEILDQLDDIRRTSGEAEDGEEDDDDDEGDEEEEEEEEDDCSEVHRDETVRSEQVEHLIKKVVGVVPDKS